MHGHLMIMRGCNNPRPTPNFTRVCTVTQKIVPILNPGTIKSDVRSSTIELVSVTYVEIRVTASKYISKHAFLCV
jgi:hypothetical protein